MERVGHGLDGENGISTRTVSEIHCILKDDVEFACNLLSSDENGTAYEHEA